MDKPNFIYISYIDSTPAELWETLTSSTATEKFWFGRWNTSDWKKGAKIESRSPTGELEWQGEVLLSEAPRLLHHTFAVAGIDEPPSQISYEIEPLGQSTQPQGNGVRLTVRHYDFLTDSKVYPQICQGWPAILSSLKSLLETGFSLELTWKM
jgi:uncharacterized protein YndB with AHSA1/START domain